MKANKEVDELLKAGIIDQATAERINNYYATKTSTPQSKLLIVFGILGVVGLRRIEQYFDKWRPKLEER